jgi:hypothetical protein
MSSADTSVTVDYSRNRLAIPGLVGDPFLSFDCDVPAGYCVTGTAIGAVALWRLDHVAEILLGKAAGDSSTAAAPADQVATDEVVCRMLASTSDEGIRHVFIRDEQSVTEKA